MKGEVEATVMDGFYREWHEEKAEGKRTEKIKRYQVLSLLIVTTIIFYICGSKTFFNHGYIYQAYCNSGLVCTRSTNAKTILIFPSSPGAG